MRFNRLWSEFGFSKIIMNLFKIILKITEATQKRESFKKRD